MKTQQLFIIDPFSKLHIASDTTILIMNELIKNEHLVYTCTEYDISIHNREKYCYAKRHTSEINQDILQKNIKAEKHDLESFDIIHIRKDPPFDTSYITLLLLLRDIKSPMLVNSPKALLEYNEKTSILLFPDHITDTLVSSYFYEIKSFIESVGGVAVLKPLFGCSGKGVKLLKLKDPALKNIILKATNQEKDKVMMQKFVNKIYEGETRVFMLEDKPLAVMKKVPKKNNFKANFDFGATGKHYTLNEKELELCKKIGAFFKRHEIVLGALDIIDSKISEINITSPGLLVETNIVNNSSYEKEIVSFLMNRLKN